MDLIILLINGIKELEAERNEKFPSIKDLEYLLVYMGEPRRFFQLGPPTIIKDA